MAATVINSVAKFTGQACVAQNGAGFAAEVGGGAVVAVPGRRRRDVGTVHAARQLDLTVTVDAHVYSRHSHSCNTRFV